MGYTPWRFGWHWATREAGSKWYFRNWTIGLLIDLHPRFINVIVGLLSIEFGVTWKRDAIIPMPYETVNGLPIRKLDTSIHVPESMGIDPLVELRKRAQP